MLTHDNIIESYVGKTAKFKWAVLAKCSKKMNRSTYKKLFLYCKHNNLSGGGDVLRGWVGGGSYTTQCVEICCCIRHLIS